MKAYFVDTNYFLRLLLKDNNEQFDTVYKLFKDGIEDKAILFTSSVCIFEIYWVLSSFYKKDKSICIEYLEKILELGFIKIENREIFQKALKLFSRTSIEFEDCYNVEFCKNSNFESLVFATFDRKITKIVKTSL